MGTVNTCYRFSRATSCSQLRSNHVCNLSFWQQFDIGWDIAQHSSSIPLPLGIHHQTISLHLKQRPKLLLLFSKHRCAQRFSLFPLLKAGKPLVCLNLVRHSSWYFVILAGVLLLALYTCNWVKNMTIISGSGTGPALLRCSIPGLLVANKMSSICSC